MFTYHRPDMANCDRCGSYVSADYVRVFSDNQGRIHSCPDCPTGREEESTASEESRRGLTFRMSEYETGTDREDGTTDSASSAGTDSRLGRVSAAVSGLF